ncbi:MAG: hypothetical protein H0V37_06920 [Chloroflexia bacterium]|nr:hypothetical protein [Chloroflexia bacterium]
MQLSNRSWFQVDGTDGYTQGPTSLDQPVGTLPVVDDARWSAALTSDSWAALLVWLLLLIVLQMAMWPVVRRVFARFPDHGWGFGRLVTLLVSGYMVWFLASLELIAFRAVWCAIAIIAAGISAYLIGRWRGTEESLREPWYRNRSILLSEGVFWGVFGLFLVYRLVNHDSYHPFWGGEKPMEFAHINAILRSAHFPPYDPWYADGLLNYYYYGMYLVAFMMKLTGIPSEIAFNLAQPTMMALLAAGAFSVASALTGALTKSPPLSRLGGLVGVILVSFSGNLVVMARMFASLTEAAPLLSDYFYWFWEPTRIIPFTIHEFPYFTGTYADLHAHVVALPITVLVIGLCFALLQDARGIVMSAFRPRAFPTVTATFWLTLGLQALALGSLFITNAWDVPTYAALAGVTMLLATRAIRPLLTRLMTAAAGTAAVGIVAYLLVLPFSRNYVALYGEIAETRTVSPLVLVEGHLGAFVLIVAFGLSFMMSRLWTNPPEICRPRIFATLLGTVLVVRWLVADRSPDLIEVLDNLTVIVAVSWLMLSVYLATKTRRDFGIPSWGMPALLLVSWSAVVWGLAVDRASFALFLGFGAVAAVIWLKMRPVTERFIVALIAAAMFVGAGVELVYLVDGLTGEPSYRMNTFFKFYNAIWILLGLACAALVAWMVQAATGQNDDRRPRWTVAPPPGIVANPTVVRRSRRSPVVEGSIEQASLADPTPLPRQWAQFGMYVSIAVIFASLMYPVAATGVRLGQEFAQPGESWTLNALDWMGYGQIPEQGLGGIVYSYDEDRDIIEWFNSEVPGSPVIAEASIGIYRCGGTRISIHTGLPVIVGWTWHESQQRGWTDLQLREADLRTLYTSTNPDEKLAILERYRVEYVVVGELERFYPSGACQSTNNSGGISAFEPLVGQNLEVAFTSGDSIVYRVVTP